MADALNDAVNNVNNNLSETERNLRSMQKVFDRLDRSVSRITKTSRPEFALGMAGFSKVVKDWHKASQNVAIAKKNLAKATNPKDQLKYLRLLQQTTAQLKESDGQVKKVMSAHADAYKDASESVENYKQKVSSAWRTQTLSGKAYTATTSSITKLIGATTLAALAVKAWDKATEAARLQQDIARNTFRTYNADLDANAGALERTSEGTQTYSRILSNLEDNVSSISLTGKPVAENYKKVTDSLEQASSISKKFFNDSKRVTSYASALSEARVTAALFGQDVEEAGRIMTRFARIAGTQSPKKLQSLTQTTLALSRSMNLDLDDSIEFVTTRMEKFGGSSVSGLEALHDLHSETVKINNIFGRTVLRTDELVRSVTELAKNSAMYATDQKLLGKILIQNTTRLQAQGQSYQQAQKNAQNYAEFVSGVSTPEWMKINVGHKLANDFQAALTDNNELSSEMTKKLEAAKEGLSKEVTDVLQNKTFSPYDKKRLIQEMVGGTEIGLKAMNAEIVKSTRGNVTVIQQLTNSSFVEAKAIVDQVRKTEEVERKAANLKGKNTEELQKQYGISEKYAKKISNDQEEAKKFVEYMEGKENESLDRTRKQISIIAKLKKQVDLKSKIAEIETEISQAGGDVEKERYRQELNDLRTQMGQASTADFDEKDLDSARAKISADVSLSKESKEAMLEASSNLQQTSFIDKLTDQLSKNATADAILRGDFKFLIEKFSSPEAIATAAAGIFTITLGTYLSKANGKMDDIITILQEGLLGKSKAKTASGMFGKMKDKLFKKKGIPTASTQGKLASKASKFSFLKVKDLATKTNVTSVIQKPEKAGGILSKLTGLLSKTSKPSIASTIPLGGTLSKAADSMSGFKSLLGIGGKFLGKAAIILTIVTTIMDFIEPIKSFINGDWKKGLIEAIPVALKTGIASIGGLLGSLLGPVGTAIGLGLASVLDDYFNISEGLSKKIIGFLQDDKKEKQNAKTEKAAITAPAAVQQPKRRLGDIDPVSNAVQAQATNQVANVVNSANVLTRISKTNQNKPLQQTAAVKQQGQQIQTIQTAATKPAKGTVLGSPQQDGSLLVRIDNFMQAFVQAGAMVSKVST